MAPPLLPSYRDMLSSGSRARRAGFTLLELLVVLALVGIAVLFGFPAIQKMIQRSKLEGVTRQTASMMLRARMESIRRGVPVTVRADFPGDRILMFTDADADGIREAGDIDLAGEEGYPLPNAIFFWGPPDPDRNQANAVVGFDEDATAGWAIFDPDGSARAAGAFRFADMPGNFLEVRVDPPATGRVQVRKHLSGTTWVTRGEGAEPWEWKY